MNITHVVENLNRGGLERMVIELVKYQRAAGHQCQVVCVYEPGALADELRALGVPVRACGKRGGFDLRALRRLRRAVREQRSEVLHTHNAVAHYQAVLATLGMPLRCIVNTRHGMGGNRRAARREWLYRQACRRTDAVVAVCEAARASAVARGIVSAKKAVVIANGIRVDAFALADADMHARLCAELGLAPATRVIGTVGRLNWAKDQAGLIRAYARVREQTPGAALVLVGGGELRGELERVAADVGMADGVHFLGDRGDVRDLLRGFNVFALSSISEGYSMALLEACATGLPVVATDVGGNREIVRDGATGRLVPARDPGALAAALAQLLGDADAAAMLGRAARAWVAAEGSIDAMARRYQELYATCAVRAAA